MVYLRRREKVSMILSTPRRRISPRTRRRYRAIRNFFRRTLGNLPQPDIKINSSIAVNVTDLTRKIATIERQLNQVNKHFQDLFYFENNSGRGIESSKLYEEQKGIGTVKDPCMSAGRKVKDNKAKIVCNVKRSDDASIHESYDKTPDKELRDDIAHEQNYLEKSIDDEEHINIQHCENLQKNRAQPNYNHNNKQSTFPSSSHQSLNEPRAGRHRTSKHYKQQSRCFASQQEYIQIPAQYGRREKKCKRRKNNLNIMNSPHRIDNHDRYRNHEDDPDQDFMTDMNKPQCNPLKLFDIRDSNSSQFLVPEEFSLIENVHDYKLCSCCRPELQMPAPQHVSNDLVDMRSNCGSQLFSRKNTCRKHRPEHKDICNNDFYDMVPVKEKTSPKSKRKFVENDIMKYDFYQNIPLLKANKPLLNKKGHDFVEDDELIHIKKNGKHYSPQKSKKQEYDDKFRAETSSEEYPARKPTNDVNTNSVKETTGAHNREDICYTIPNSEAINETHEIDSSVDKTEKALLEIKSILQILLQEVKKEQTIPCQSECSGNTDKPNNKHIGVNTVLNNHCVGHCKFPTMTPPYVQSLRSCYQVIPACPLNCTQNGYFIPNSIFTCQGCSPVSKDSNTSAVCCSKNITNYEITAPKKSNETEDLIKEIHKYVTQNPNGPNETIRSDKSPRQNNPIDAGKASIGCRRDANVGTNLLYCFSRSCEVIGSKVASDTYRSRGSYSDTILEKLSLAVTAQSSSVSESNEHHIMQKKKTNKFAQVLRSFGLLKSKDGKDAIKELSESESAVEVDMKLKRKKHSLLKPHITNCMTHGQTCYRPSQLRDPSYHPSPGSPCCNYGYNSCEPQFFECASGIQPLHDIIKLKRDHQCASYHQHPSAPPYPSYEIQCHNLHPQVPLCLKEIEVKSIGTQVDQKKSFFNKFSKKIRCSSKWCRDCDQRNWLTKPACAKSNWKDQRNYDPDYFIPKMQNKLADCDAKIFYKRNPFSPRNLVRRAMFGKDRCFS